VRGGGGVNGAIHRTGGPTVLADCKARFPRGLATGDAGWTTAGDLPARWIIHTVGPNYRAGQHDRPLLESCYRRSLEVADELGVRTITFPLIGTGMYGWPLQDAIAAAVETIAATVTRVDEVRLVAFDDTAFDAISRHLALSVPLRILQAVRVLHRRGHQQARVLPGMSPSGMHWRVSITSADNYDDSSRYPGLIDWDRAIHYSSGGGADSAGTQVSSSNTAEEIADVILSALPSLQRCLDDADYAAWYDELLRLVEEHNSLPIAYDDYFDVAKGWEVEPGSGIRHRPPTPVRR